MTVPVSSAGSWLLPAAKEAYAHRKDIANAWEKLYNYFLGKKSALAITGMAGVGKTVLYDHLRGDAPKLGYQPPGTSRKAERGHVLSSHQRIGLVVVPGQHFSVRLEELGKLFADKPGVDGVIHVVSYGYNTIRQEEMQQLFRERGIKDLDEFLRLQRQKVLRITCRPQITSLSWLCKKILVMQLLSRLRMTSLTILLKEGSCSGYWIWPTTLQKI